VGELLAEKRTTEMKLMHTRSQLEDVRASVRVKEDIFKSGKGYEEQLFSQLKSLQSEQNDLCGKQRQMEVQSAGC
jgi:hypothetical protein